MNAQLLASLKNAFISGNYEKVSGVGGSQYPLLFPNPLHTAAKVAFPDEYEAKRYLSTNKIVFEKGFQNRLLAAYDISAQQFSEMTNTHEAYGMYGNIPVLDVPQTINLLCNQIDSLIK